MNDAIYIIIIIKHLAKNETKNIKVLGVFILLNIFLKLNLKYPRHFSIDVFYWIIPIKMY